MNLGRVLKSYLAEFHARFAGRHFGRFAGFAVDVQDPEQVGRIRVKVPYVFGDAASGWCWPAAGRGANSSGSPAGLFDLPEVGDMVWVEFQEGSPEARPIWSPGPWSKRSTPDHARGLPDDSDLGIKGVEGAPIPDSSFGADRYGRVRIWQTPAGHRIEMDDTPGAERVQLHHRSGGHLEILPDGTVHVGAVGTVRIQATTGSVRTHAGEDLVDTADGSRSVTVAGSDDLQVERDQTIEVGGSLTYIRGRETGTVRGDLTALIEGSETRQVFGNATTTLGGQWSVQAGGDVQIQASGALYLLGMNDPSTGGNPLDPGGAGSALELVGYNGRASLRASTSVGVEQGFLELNQQGQAVLSALSAVFLGGEIATNPLCLFQEFATFMTSLLTWLGTHTHSAAVIGSTGTPIAPFTGDFSGVASTKVFAEQ